MAYCGGATPQNAKYLASKTGLDPTVVLAWLNNECQDRPNPTNPLNILYYGSHGQIGQIGRFGTYSSTQAGLDHAAWLINNSSYYAGIRKAIATRDPRAEARAIELSPWAGGNYGATSSRLGGISRTYQRLVGTVIDWSKYIGPPTSKPPTGIPASSTTNPALAAFQKLLASIGISTDPTHVFTHQEATDILTKLYHFPIGSSLFNEQIGTFEGHTVAEASKGNTVNLNPFDALSGAVNAVGQQLADTFTWIGFIFVGAILLLVGGFLISRSGSKDE